MDYKISDICSILSIGKSTIYSRIEYIKKEIPESDWRNNSYFYYNDKNKLFFTKKGFNFIKDFKSKNKNKNTIRQDSTGDIVLIYQNQLIDMYKQRIEYLENENKRLLDIISVREQRELAKDIKKLKSSKREGFLSGFINKFKNM